jgi:predicted flap endonuclease-1-like 5' DNA nuclease
LFWIAIGGIFFSLLCVSGSLLRAALWPPPRGARRTVETRTITAATAAGADDLGTIEGIGPAVAALLRAQGIRTFAALASYRAAELRQILRRDPDLARTEPSTWAFQARLLAEGRYGDFVRLIARLNCGVPRLCNIEGIDKCSVARLRAGGICTIAELQRSTVAQVVNCFPQNDRAQVTRWAPRWIEHAALLHEGDEATLCALARIARPSGQVRAEARQTNVRTASAAEMASADSDLVAYWRRESWLRLLCAPLGGLALLLFLLLIALLGLIPSRHGSGTNVVVGGGGGTTISMIQGGWPPGYGPNGQNGQNGQNGLNGMNGMNGMNGQYIWQYGPYGPYPVPVPQPYPPYPWPYPPYPPGPNPACPQSPCPGASCNSAPCPAPTPPPSPAPETCACSTSETCECSDSY